MDWELEQCVRAARKGRGYEDAIVIAQMRSASTFLISCLGSHTDVEAYDGEILLPGSAWREDGGGDLDVLNRYYDRVALGVICAKITYVQVSEPVLQFVADNGLKIIHLTRENVLRFAFSAAVNQHTQDRRYGHIREGVERPAVPQFAVDPAQFLGMARRCDTNQRRMRERLDQMPNEVLHLTYAAIVGGEGRSAKGVPEETGREICAFLGIPYEPLTSDRRKSNPWAMREVITNWWELEKAISRSNYGTLLREVGKVKSSQ